MGEVSEGLSLISAGPLGCLVVERTLLPVVHGGRGSRAWGTRGYLGDGTGVARVGTCEWEGVGGHPGRRGHAADTGVL